MKNRGFTLIELLAVIVILAIIALIAVPIIINIINDSRENVNKRSVELYGKAVENAVAQYQVNNPSNTINGDGYTSTTLEAIEGLSINYNGTRVNCGRIDIYSDGKIYMDQCTVGTNTKEYTYGTEQVTQVYKPQYYSWGSGWIEGSLPNDASQTAPANKQFYLGLDVEENSKLAVYGCFIRNETEYCLKGFDADAYETNQAILDEAFSDVEDACSFGDYDYSCYAYADDYGFSASTNENGNITMSGGSMKCFIYSNGTFSCYVY